MYKDNGKLDVELLAEVGSIAHRIRNLDEKLALDQTKSACFKYPYPVPASKSSIITVETTTTAAAATAIVAIVAAVDCEQTKISSPNRTNSSHSIQIAQDIGNKLNENSAATEPAPTTTTKTPIQTSDGDINNKSTTAAGCGGRRYSNKHIEDIILEFYEKHLIYHQNLEKERIASQDDTPHIRSKIYRLTRDVNHTMNDSSTVAASNTGNTTTIATDTEAATATATASIETNVVEQTIFDECDQQSSVCATKGDRKCAVDLRIRGEHGEDNAGKLTINSCCSTSSASDNDNAKRNSITNIQQMPEIQISGSDDDRTTTPTSATKLHTEVDDSGSGGAFDSTGTGTCSHYCGGWQSSICANQLSDEDLRKLVVELKRKVEFTERMNWLCE